ncbi:hypothetical protein K8I31_08060, partial [bacterium]|nr:hypothetical protein [bacterium]
MNYRFTRHIFASLLIASLAIPAFSQGIFDQSVDWPMLGSVKTPGSASESGGVYNMKGNGDDIWNAADGGYYIYTEKA